MARILITDDEPRIREMIRKYAEHEGHTVFEAENGMDAVEQCRTSQFDLIIMDIMMPELDGFSAVREIRKQDANVPVIMLTALGEEYDRIHGFDVGVDDYVVKPFSIRELMMRIQAILKRTQGGRGSGDHLIVDEMDIDLSARTVTIAGERVNLSPKEYELLVYLAKNAGIALTREQILQTVWGYDFFGDDRTLDTHIKLLRRNIGDYSKYIVTLRGIGYRFEKQG